MNKNKLMIENFLSNVNNFWLTEPRYRSKVMGPYFALTLKNDLQKYNILDKQTCFLWVKMLSVYSFSTWWTKYVEFGLTHKNYKNNIDLKNFLESLRILNFVHQELLNDLAKAHPQGFVIVLQVARHTKLLQNFNFLTFHNRELLITLIQNDWFLPVNSWDDKKKQQILEMVEKKVIYLPDALEEAIWKNLPLRDLDLCPDWQESILNQFVAKIIARNDGTVIPNHSYDKKLIINELFKPTETNAPANFSFLAELFVDFISIEIDEPLSENIKMQQNYSKALGYIT